MSHRRAVLSLLVLAGVLLSPGLPAQAATKNVPVQGTNWFWTNQQRPAPSDLGVTCPDGAPACPDQRFEGANTHEVGALPVMVTKGENEKISSILFNFQGIIPFQGGVINKFTFSVIESQDPRDRAQTVDVTGHKIQACLITEVWTPSEVGADEMKDAPDFDEENCVDGTRKPDASPPRWDFVVTNMVAAQWGQGPSSAFGVMLVGNKPENSQESWQIVLKGTRRDDATTAEVNEAKANQNNIKASIDLTPNPAPTFASSGFGDFSNTGGSFGFGDSGFGTTPAAGSTFPGTTTPTTPTAPGTAPVAAGGPTTTAPTMPGYFWLLIPAGLMALSLVRHTVLEPLPGKRPDGVVALIRRHNAARLGRPIAPDAAGALVALSGVFRKAGLRIRSLTRRVLSGGKRR